MRTTCRLPTLSEPGHSIATRRTPHTSGLRPDRSLAAFAGQLQRSVGNQAVGQFLHRQALQREAAQDEERQAVQAKRDSGEIQREAAEEEEAPVQTKRLSSAPLQREAAPGEEEEAPVQTKRGSSAIQREAAEEEEAPVQAKRDASVQREAAPEEEGQPVQAKFAGGTSVQRADAPEEKEEEGAAPVQAKAEVGLEGGALSRAVAGRIEGRRGGGSPLDTGLRGGLEGAFGTSFADVRIHTDTEADALNRTVSAVAFTTGSDIFFRQGAYRPESPAGKELLAHELTHVVQQRSMSASGPMAVGPAGDSHEQEADATGARVARMLETDGALLRARHTDTARHDATMPPAATGELRRRILQRDGDQPAQEGDPPAAQVEPLPEMAGEGEPDETVAYAGLKLQGRTNARFSNSFRTTNTTTAAGTGCDCPPGQCVHVTGTLESTFTVTTTVTLPRVSDFPNLPACARQRVRDAIDTVLAPHEQQHVAAFATYNGTVSTPYDLTMCRSAVAGAIQALHNSLQSARRTAAQSASDSLDPFSFDVDLDCEEEQSSLDTPVAAGAEGVA